MEITPELVKGITIAIGAVGPAIGLGLIGAAAVNSVGRNPEAQSKILTMALVMAGLVDAIMVFVLLIVFTTK
ncbi:ATP synthase F0 subunit C [Candidatus Saccharibacteria bacterium]|jgi:F-type H+-transporting ATPase subunit c|nr:ATP synthase F0 subunit C [Candidatus Saccharibacteria bacterium]MBP7834629.1 ATP synthase F0 subunit C [Candidatus Saccharibacteria bacterium]